jgi:2-methylcitrate dehydratase PrpD
VNLAQFIHETRWSDLPPAVQHQTRRCLLDTVGAGIAGSRTETSRIVRNVAAAVFGGNDARLWLDGRSVSAPGAALANGMTIDSLDIHDGHPLVKGHAGAAVVPSLIAMAEHGQTAPDGRELLTALAVGYEVALRAGIALHRTACDYHTSGAWNALGCAAVAARRIALNAEQTRQALGIAEYHGPRSQMMRCIDHPTMVKDGSGWGAMTGISAALLAEQGFTGAPIATAEDPAVADLWTDLGDRWRMNEQYFKPYAVCRWAQPAVAGALILQQCHDLPLDSIARIEVRTFHEATRLATRRPESSDEAQYSLPFPVAAALVHGKLGLDELTGAGLDDPLVLRLADRVALIDDPALSARFPAERYASVMIELDTGATFSAGDVRAPWDGIEPPSDNELLDKFRWLASETVSAKRAETAFDRIWNCADLSSVEPLLDVLSPVPDRPRT